MPELRRIDDLDIDQSEKVQEGTWIAQRIGWVLMGLFVIAALAGVFGGNGPLSRAEAGSDSLSVKYDRFTRFSAPLSFQIQAKHVNGNELVIAIDKELGQAIEIVSVSPQPEQETQTAAGTQYRFAVEPGGSIDIAIEAKSQKTAGVDGTIEIVDGPQVPISMFVYP